jgi:hypothetical protein
MKQNSEHAFIVKWHPAETGSASTVPRARRIHEKCYVYVELTLGDWVLAQCANWLLLLKVCFCDVNKGHLNYCKAWGTLNC